MSAIEDCVATSYGANCRFVYSGAVEIALFYGPVVNTYALYVDRGTITGLELRSTTIQAGDPWQQVLDWVEENYPEDRGEMILPTTREVLAHDDAPLWLELLPQYKATLDG